MRELPQGAALLQYAREILRKEILPVLPAEHRLTGLMIANAMGIAARQLHNGDEQDYQELIALRTLLDSLGHEFISPSSTADSQPEKLQFSHILSHTTLQQELTILNRQLAKIIRKRELKDQQALVFNHLEHITAIRAAESSG
ncbi:DUF6285 domain-containing protein [Psychrobacter sanguinis]|uniref:DUF6285 domain-containing protein n=1 Tax=Psychrobacter sanguinis TaxID=861445 RepID=A0A844M385_9GAMM|nr:DUF6285 domain-containing protein [Psychrobacter sanguinis]MUG33386.1 hypothetical protein [Psychrobacter sanguinis]